MTRHPPKPKRCKVCKAEFTPLRPMQKACSIDCAKAMAVSERGKREAKEAARERVETRKRKEAIKTIPQLIAEADRAFMEWIRCRDRLAGHPCISSGRPLDWTANQVDAGHYRSRGAASHLRYHPDNCHAQAKQENRWLSGNAVDYRARLIERIGLARVEALESDNTPHKWAREELTEIRDEYRARVRAMKKEQA